MTATTTGPPQPPPPSDVEVAAPKRNLIFTAVLLGMLLAALDQTIVATALPTVVADLGGAGHQAWVVTSYLLASTVVTAIVGKLGDLHRPQDHLHRCRAVLHGRFGAVRTGRLVPDAGGCARPAGRRRRGHHGHGDRGDRRGHPAARTRPLPGRARRGVRCHDGHRPAARRILHRPPELALGVLDQRARCRRRAGGRRHRDPQPRPDGASGHRLRRNRAGRSGRHGAHAGHQLGRQHLPVGFADDHRALRRIPGGHRRIHRRRTAGAGTDSADAAVPRAGLHRLLRAVVRRRLRDARRVDVPADVHAIRRRRVGHHLGPAHLADGGRAARRCR